MKNPFSKSWGRVLVLAAIGPIYARWGAVQSVEFLRVETYGHDVYAVRQEGGVSTWIIVLDSNGLIEDAHNIRGL